MKSEHRHELAENDLAKFITRGLKKIEPYQNQILLAMLVITVAVVSGVMLRRSSSAGKTEGLAELLNCKTGDDYLAVADTFSGTVAGHWARLRAGEDFLQEGIRLSITDRAQAVNRLEEAEEAFEKLRQDQSVSDEVRLRALYGLAMTLESLGTDTEKAIAAYNALLNAPGGSQYQEFAEDRIKVLETGRGQQFYAWFEAQNPSPEDRPRPRDMPNPFESMFDEEAESDDGLPPPPPTTHRHSAEATAPEPPADEAGDGERPALPAPGTTNEEGAASGESTTDESYAPADE